MSISWVGYHHPFAKKEPRQRGESHPIFLWSSAPSQWVGEFSDDGLAVPPFSSCPSTWLNQLSAFCFLGTPNEDRAGIWTLAASLKNVDSKSLQSSSCWRTEAVSLYYRPGFYDLSAGAVWIEPSSHRGPAGVLIQFLGMQSLDREIKLRYNH